MTEAPGTLADAEPAPRLDLDEHRLGEHDQGLPGPLFLFTGGLHGNEPGGVQALRELLAALGQSAGPFHGRLVCLAGNLEALRQGRRFLDADLNRVWAGRLTGPRTGAGEPGHEAQARDRLAAELEAELAAARGPVVLLDLHSTSGQGAPFSIIGDTLQNRRIALALPVPVILGLEENVEGSLLGELGELGHVAIGFEGGQHTAPDTSRNLLAAAWLALESAGAFGDSSPPAVGEARSRLAKAGAGLPAIVETRYRHHVEVREEFEMLAGFDNFDPVERGALLAHHGGSEVRAHEPGRVLLPLYQGQGQDGFFLARDVRPFWLGVSAWLRALGAPRLLPLLPGVRRVAGVRGCLEVDRRLARWWVLEVFHLCGFRRREEDGPRLRFSRRVEGPAPGA